MTIEVLAIAIAALNGFILLIKPIGRLHTRLDMIEYRLGDVEGHLAKLAGQSYDRDS